MYMLAELAIDVYSGPQLNRLWHIIDYTAEYYVTTKKYVLENCQQT